MNKTSKEKRLVCTVNRRTWARGDKNGPSRLLNQGGYMCCLGFLSLACQVPKEMLLNHLVPSYNSLGVELNKLPRLKEGWWLFVEANDDSRLSDLEREKRLKELAKENGFSFRFAGKDT